MLGPIGTSGHSVVSWRPKEKTVPKCHDTKTVSKRCSCHFPSSKLDASGRWISNVNWFGDVDPGDASSWRVVHFTTVKS